MGTVVDITIPSDQFALGATFDTVSGAKFEIVRVAAHGPRSVMPFLWASSSQTEKLDEALRSDETTEAVTRLSGSTRRTLYRIDWRPSVRAVIENFVQANGCLLAAQGQSDQWELRIVFPDRASVSETFENWRNHGIEPSIRRINGVSNMVDYGGMDLSSCQQETLLEAFEMDYYDIPRGISLDALADELDISHQALSERFRRGHRNLVETTLCESPSLVSHEL